MGTRTLIAGPLPKVGRTELATILVKTTGAHWPFPHHEIVEEFERRVQGKGLDILSSTTNHFNNLQLIYSPGRAVKCADFLLFHVRHLPVP